MGAFQTFFQHDDPSMRLFVNVTPRLMLRHLDENPHGLPWTLEILDQIGIDPHRVVIELTEEAAGAETESLRRLVDVYRSHGCGIALDDVGADSSNLDRIGLFEPEIIKVDGAMLRRSLREKSFRHVLEGVGAMADGLGSWLLFEGVETDEELQLALGFGARYIQGWYFAKAGPMFLPADAFVSRLKEPLLRFAEHEVGEADAVAARVRTTLARLGAVPAIKKGPEPLMSLGAPDLERWDGVACRVFVTDRHGFQVSPNYVSLADGWIEDSSTIGRYRAGRPYFPGPNHAPWGPSWSVSTVYFDVNDQRPMRTFGHRTPDGLFVFVDVLEIEKPH